MTQTDLENQSADGSVKSVFSDKISLKQADESVTLSIFRFT
ncbi:hypothetical protein [Bartonella elizabethae]|nr:hypothetical protein [Bartonella elizabethae]